LECLEDPEADAARGLCEAEGGPPCDVLKPGLDGCVEQQHAASVGSTYP
jgi:hypothetical protein